MTTTSPARRIEHMPLSEIINADRNPKKHDIPGIRRSMEKFGCTVAGILDERTGRLVAGHGRIAVLNVMLKEGAPPPDGITGDEGEWTVPVVRGWSSNNDLEAEAYIVADNRLNEIGGWNDKILADILEDIADGSYDLLALTGYSSDNLDDMVASLGDVQVLPPAPTNARYAETEEETEERRAHTSTYVDRKVGGTVAEMILVFTGEEHSETVGLIRAIRARDGEQTAAQVVLSALRSFAPDEDDE